MVYFTRGVNSRCLTKVRQLLKCIISMPICHTYVLYSTNTEIVDCFIYFFSNNWRRIYKNILLIYDVLVSCYWGGDYKADGCKCKCLLLLANLFFTPVYSTGPSPAISEYVQQWRLYLARNMNYVGFMDRDPIVPVSWVEELCPGVPQNEFRMPNVPGSLSSHVETMKSLGMCEDFNFPTLAKASTAVRQPSANHWQRNRTGRGVCVDKWL